MRIIIPLLVISLVSCSRNERVETDIFSDLSLISEKSNPVQIFNVNPLKDTAITCKEGTVLIITAGSFVDKHNEPVNSMVDINVKEIYSASEMIFNGLSTVSNGTLLESSGMVHITATSESEELKLAEGSPIRIQFKKIANSPFMRTFLGLQDLSQINWVLDENNIYDTILYTEPTQMVVQLDYGADSLVIVNVTYGVIGTDTTRFRETTELDTKLYAPFYQIHSTELNWINCDYFIDSEDNIDIQIAKLEDVVTMTYLVFEDLNSIMGAWEYNEANMLFKNIPRDSNVKVVSIAKNESGYLLSIEDITLSQDNQRIALSYQKSTLEEISKQIDLLN